MDTQYVHLHSTHWRDGDPAGCLTVCGRDCDSTTAYRALDPERVTCPTCASEYARVGASRPLYAIR